MLFHVRIEGQPQGPWPLREIVMMSGVTLDTPVCPEFELGQWRPLDTVIGKGSDAAFLFRIRTRAEQLLRMNQKMRWELQQQTEDHRKALEEEKKRTAEAHFELEQRKAQLDDVLDHNLELDTGVEQTRERLEQAERRLEQARNDFERSDGERKALQRRGDSLERELDDLRRLDSDAAAARAKMKSLEQELTAANSELVRAKTVKAARDRQFEELTGELENAQRKAVETEARMRTLAFEKETAEAERSKELEIWRAKAEKAEGVLEEKRLAQEELKLRIGALEARAAEAEERLRSETSSSSAKGESLQSERETLASELEKAKLLASERAKTIDDLRAQIDAAREQVNEVEGRLRVAQTKFSGAEAALREEKESLFRQVEVEKSRRNTAEMELERVQNEMKTLEGLGEAATTAQHVKVEELENSISSLKQDLIRKSQTIERLETRLQESEARPPAAVPAGPLPEEPSAQARSGPDDTLVLPPAPEPAPAPESETPEPAEAAEESQPETPPSAKTPDPDATLPFKTPASTPEAETPPEGASDTPPEPAEPFVEAAALSPEAPTVEVGPGTDVDAGVADGTGRRKKLILALAAVVAAAAAGGAAYWFRFLKPAEAEKTSTPPAEEVMELSPETEKRFEEVIETPPPAPTPPKVLRPDPKKKRPRRTRKRLKRVQPIPKKSPEPPAEPVPLPGYGD
jgi:predicted  nucleic acid-binding Zn-ribbon protein